MDQVKVGKFIEACRKNSKLTQEQLAEKLFVDRTLISKWEHGKLCPDIKYYQKLCEIFQIELKELIFGEKNNNSNKSELNNNLIGFLEKQSHMLKLFRNIMIVLFIILFTFLLYYFFQTFNKTRVFTFYGNSKHFSVNHGLLVLTREKSYLSLNSNDFKSDSISIYYYLNNDKNIIYEGPSTNVVIDFSGYNSSINILNYKKIIDNIFLDINLDNTKETIHLNFEENYSNHKLFFKNDNNVSKSPQYEYSDKSVKIGDCEEDICTYQDDDYQIVYDTITRKITIINNTNDMFIDYFIDTKWFNYSDSKINFEAVEGKIACGKSECINEEKIYKKFYEKYIKKCEKD